MPLDSGSLTEVRVQAVFTALPLAFGVLHLLLFAALPRLRSHLYYSLFLIAIAATIYLDFEEQMTASGPEAVRLLRLHRAAMALTFISALRFFYEVFVGYVPRRYRYLTAALVVAGGLAVIRPGALSGPLQVLGAGGLVEIGRVMLAALQRRQEDVWLIAAGFVTFAGFACYDLLLDVGALPVLGGVHNAYQFGLVGLFAATSAYLARGIAHTSDRLLAQERLAHQAEMQRQLFAKEAERTAAELDEARALQLSLLPSPPEGRADVEIAVHMATASEVGGDYYDFLEAPDGALTVVVGDATGHGLRAGMLVAVAKSLVQGLSADEPLPAFFRRCTRVLKPMRLGNLFMALMVVRLRAGRLTVASAGMPPLLLHRSATGAVDEVRLRGMPLGAFADFPYPEVTLPIEAGDTLLLMSDGLIEQFDARREMFGWERVLARFAEAAAGTPEDIVRHLRAADEAWRGDVARGDDVTLVVVRVEEAGQVGAPRESRGAA